MTIITRERLLTIQQWRETYGPGSNVVLPAEEAEELARIVLASLEAEPVSQTYKLPELIVGMEVSIDVSTCDADAGNRYFGTVTEVSELYTAKNGYILLVQDAKPNFDVNGNTPVQSPIDHGYRPECECSGCKATARICAELNNEEAEIFADGYNAAMQSFGNSEQLNFPVAPDEIEPDDGNTFDYVDGWNACRAAMLQSKYRDLSQPVDPQISEYEKTMLQAGNSPVIPDGYALVPVNPTDEMIVAAMDSDDVTYNESDDTIFYVHHREIYKAMLAAAPQPEENNE